MGRMEYDMLHNLPLEASRYTRQSIGVPAKTTRHFTDSRRKDAMLSRLFKKVDRKLFKLEQSMYDVSTPYFGRYIDDTDSSCLVPEMGTDVMPQFTKKVVVIGTGYYQKPLCSHTAPTFAF